MSLKLLLDIKKAMASESTPKVRKNQQLIANKFKVEQTLNKGGRSEMLISGIALAEGTNDGLYYPANELEKYANGLVGKPLCVDHNGHEIVGKVTATRYEDGKIFFDGIVEDEDAQNLIKNDGYMSVSPSVWSERKFTDFGVAAYDLSFDELSLVKESGCKENAILETSSNVEEADLVLSP